MVPWQDLASNADVIYRNDLSHLLHSATRLGAYAQYLTQHDPDDPKAREDSHQLPSTIPGLIRAGQGREEGGKRTQVAIAQLEALHVCWRLAAGGDALHACTQAGAA